MSKHIREIFHEDLTLKSDKWDPYFDVYQDYASKFVGKECVVVEVGVQGGGSLQMWRKFLGPKAYIYGIDIDPTVLERQQYLDDRTHIIIGDQEKPEFWHEFLSGVPNIDLFVDDGGHTMRQQVFSLNLVFPHITDGGVYICEDTLTSYLPWMVTNRGDSFIEYTKNILDIVNINKDTEKFINLNMPNVTFKDLHSIHYYNSMVVFLKKMNREFKNVIVNEK